LLIILLRYLIAYKGGIIYFKIKQIIIIIKRRTVKMLFNISLLEKNKVVLEMLWLREYNLKINWVIKNIKIMDTWKYKIY